MANVLSLVWDTVIVLNVNKPIGYAEVLLPVQLETVSFRHVAVSCIRGSFLTYQYHREKEYKTELLDSRLQDYNDRLYEKLSAIEGEINTIV